MTELTVITGPMKAAKTTLLIEKVRSAMAVRHRAMVFRPISDTRTDQNHVVSRLGCQHPAFGIEDPFSILNHLDKFDLAAIDEAQMFRQDLYFVVESLLLHNKELVVAGLNLDYRGMVFPEMAKVIARATTIIRLKARCDLCSLPASYTQRLDGGKETEDAFAPTIVIEGASEYQARCDRCFVPPKNLRDYVYQLI